MVSKETEIVNKMGFHMRPASVFSAAMAKYKSSISLIVDGKKTDGKSVMNIMASCIKCGSKITVECDGEDENEMLAEAVAMIDDGFGE